MQSTRGSSADGDFFDTFRAGQLKVSEVIAYYAALVYRQTGSYESAAERLGLDRRTVKAKVQEYLASRGPNSGPSPVR